MAAGEHLVGGPLDSLSDLRLEQAEGAVDARRWALHLRQGMDHGERHALARDAEEAPAALGLRPPEPIRGHLDGAEGVLLQARGRHRLRSF